MSPDFESNSTTSPPYIYIEGNSFTKNMAYFGGNALYITHTVKRITSFDHYRNMCGAGVYIGNNQFVGNIGLKKHNGGAIVHQCIDHGDMLTGYSARNKTSSLMLAQRDPTAEEQSKSDRFMYYYDDPATTTDSIADIFDPTQNTYTVLKYATVIQNNNFTQNYAGMKGSALYLSKISVLQISQNTFLENGPVTTFSEILYSPYYKYFANYTRTLSFNVPKTCTGVSNEFSYAEYCDSLLNFIDMPALTGAVHIENCQDDYNCLNPITQTYLTNLTDQILDDQVDQVIELILEEFARDHQVSVPIYTVQIEANIFENNQILPPLQKEQTSDQASCLYIKGGKNTIRGNLFESHRNLLQGSIYANAPKIYSFMPENYFEYSQASLIYISYENSGTNSNDYSRVFKTDIDSNTFIDNRHYQHVVVPVQFYGSLINFLSTINNMDVIVRGNTLSYNQFIGKNAALISIKGGVMDIENNISKYNGYISQETLFNHPNTVEQSNGYQFPYSSYYYEHVQEKGVFHFSFAGYKDEMRQRRYHKISRNVFSHNFCFQGCAYSASGTTQQQILFEQNDYSYQYALKAGSVFHCNYRLEYGTGKLFLQTFKNETIKNTAGGAIVVNNLNLVGYTFVQNCTFFNNFNDKGGAIKFHLGGSLVSFDNHFSLDVGYIDIPEDIYDLMQANNLINSDNRKDSLIDYLKLYYKYKDNLSLAESIRSTYHGVIPLNELIEEQSLLSVDQITNDKGQINLRESNIIFGDYLGDQILHENMSMVQFFATITDYTAEIDGASYFANTIFENLQGTLASAVVAESTDVVFISAEVSGNRETKEVVHFHNNVATQGATILGKQSTILMRSITMIDNIGLEGGCIKIFLNCEFDAVDSTFSRNTGMQGGVIFAIQRSIFQIRNSLITENISNDGSFLYAMSNKINKSIIKETKFIQIYKPNPFALTGPPLVEESLQVLDSEITNNWSEKNLIDILQSEMKISNCNILDNYSRYVTHGVTLITSEITVEATKISFSDEMNQKIRGLRLENLDTGFFNLYPNSVLYLTNKTEVMNLTAQRQSVLSAISQSQVTTSNDVKFIDNSAMRSDGVTMLFRNTKKIRIADTYFKGNQQINISINVGQLQVRNSTFTQGKKNHIYASSADVLLYEVKFINSSDLNAIGHAIMCRNCDSLNVIRSSFKQLEALYAPAIYIRRQMESNTLIQNSLFQDNYALESSGAIRLEEAGFVHLKHNSFIKNQAKLSDDFIAENDGDTTCRTCDAGAVYFKCDPGSLHSGWELLECQVVLEDNRFAGNRAFNKGGALRYVNRNFTTALQAPDGRIKYSDPIVERSRILNDTDDDDDVEWTDTNAYYGNQAAYGSNIASYPGSFTYMFFQDDKQFTEQDEVVFSPGQELGLKIQILDQEGRISTDENEVVCRLTFDEKGLEANDGRFIINPDRVANQGVCTFNQLAILRTPGKDASIEFKFSNLELFNNDMKALTQIPSIKVQAATCKQGERYTEDLQCKPCGPGYKLYDFQKFPGVCDACIENSEVCFGSNFTAPMPTYWRSSPTSVNYIKCFNPDVCLGGDEEHPLGRCEEGYDGVMCANCIGRFRRQGPFECTECPSQTVNMIISFSLLVALLLIIGVLVSVNVRSAFNKKPMITVLLKIFVNHFQLIQVIASIDFGWPNLVQKLMRYQQLLAQLPTKIISFDCFMIDYVTGADPSLRLNYLKLGAFVAMPLLVFTVSYFFWLIKSCCTKYTSEQRMDRVISTTAIIWFLFYPVTVEEIASSINCTDIDGVQRLYKDLEEVCFTGLHLKWLLFVSVPGLIIEAFGIPLLGLYLIRRNRKMLAEQEFHTNPRYYSDFQARINMQMGFLTQGYQEKYYYWEIILLLRKTVIVLMMVFFAPLSSGMQSLSAIVLLIVSLIVHQSLQPYYDQKLNNLESASLFCQIFIIYFGLYYQAGKNDHYVTTKGTMYCIFLFILIVSSYFLGLLVIYLRKEFLKGVATRSDKCFRFLSCCCIKSRQNFISVNKLGTANEDEILQSSVKQKEPDDEELNSERDNSKLILLDNVDDTLKNQSVSKVLQSQQSYDSYASDQQQNVTISDMFQSAIFFHKGRNQQNMSQLSMLNQSSMNKTAAVEMKKSRNVPTPQQYKHKTQQLVANFDNILQKSQLDITQDSEASMRSILKNQRGSYNKDLNASMRPSVSFLGFKQQISEVGEEDSDVDKKSERAQAVQQPQPEPVDSSRPMPQKQMFTLSDIGMGDDIHDDVSSIGHNEMTFFKNIHQDSRRTVDSCEVPIEEIKDRQSRRTHQKLAQSMDSSNAPAEIDKIVTAYNQHMQNSNTNPLARTMGNKDLKKEGLFKFGQNKQNNRAGSYVETPPESDDLSMLESSSHYSKNNLEFNLGKVQEQEQDLKIFEESDEQKEAEADEKVENDTKTVKSNKSRKQIFFGRKRSNPPANNNNSRVEKPTMTFKERIQQSKL